MAKSKSSNTGQRGLSNRPLTQLLLYPIRPAPVLLPVPSSQPSIVREAGDRRLFQPDRSTRPPHASRPGASRVRAGKTLNQLAFADPQYVAICARRKIRKQVLFALKKTRKGAHSRKRHNFWSIVKC